MIQKIESDKNYWLVRTFSGKYYSDFVQNGYIAIGWNEISDIEIIKDAEKDPKIKEHLYDLARKYYINKKNEQPGRVVSPIMRFVNEMNIGDIVIIPSENSKIIQFGVIKSDVEIIKDVINLDEGLDPLYKQRKVDWITWREKDSVDLNIFKMLSAHSAVSKVNDYAEHIDRTMYSFYTKNGRAHMVIRVSKEGGYTGTEIPDLINNVLCTVNLYNEITGETISKDEVETKISLQSDGFLILSGSEEIITLILVFGVFLHGGTLEVKNWFKVGGKGLIPTLAEIILNAKEQSHRQKMEVAEQEFRHSLKKIELEFPKNQNKE